MVIRTNGFGTVLTVNAPNDTVHHYDCLDELTITAVANASYHEHGIVRGKAIIKEGHIVVENGASIPQISVEGATGAVKVTANESVLVNVDSTSASQASVVANADGVYVTGISIDKISGSQASAVELPTVVTTEEEFAAAISAKKRFIQLGADFNATSTHTISAKTLIDFGGHTITVNNSGTTQEQYVAAIMAMTEGFEFVNSPFITNNSILTFTSTDESEAGGITSNGNVVLLNNASLVINNGFISSTLQLHKFYSGRGAYNAKKDPSTWDLSNEQNTYRGNLNATIYRGVIRNMSNGNLTINNVYLYTKSDYGVYSLGKATINGGTFNSDSSSANGGYAYCVTNVGEMTINNAVIRGDHGGLAGNDGKLVINNVDTKAKQFYGLYAAGEVGYSSCEINNGRFESEAQSAVLVGNSSDGGNGLPASVTINNGLFIGGINNKGVQLAAVRASEVKGGGTYGLGFITIYGGKYNTDVSGANGVKTCTQGSDGYWVVNQ